MLRACPADALLFSEAGLVNNPSTMDTFFTLDRDFPWSSRTTMEHPGSAGPHFDLAPTRQCSRSRIMLTGRKYPHSPGQVITAGGAHGAAVTLRWKYPPAQAPALILAGRGSPAAAPRGRGADTLRSAARVSSAIRVDAGARG